MAGEAGSYTRIKKQTNCYVKCWGAKIDGRIFFFVFHLENGLFFEVGDSPRARFQIVYVTRVDVCMVEGG